MKISSSNAAAPADATAAYRSCRTPTSRGGGSFDLDEALNAPWSLGRQLEESDSLVDNMPSVLFSDEAICSVCKTAAGAGKRVPCCGHVYHAECISSWLYHRDSCPLCRFNLLR